MTTSYIRTNCMTTLYIRTNCLHFSAVARRSRRCRPGPHQQRVPFYHGLFCTVASLWGFDAHDFPRGYGLLLPIVAHPCTVGILCGRRDVAELIVPCGVLNVVLTGSTRVLGTSMGRVTTGHKWILRTDVVTSRTFGTRRGLVLAWTEHTATTCEFWTMLKEPTA